jgi:hypothetical protein
MERVPPCSESDEVEIQAAGGPRRTGADVTDALSQARRLNPLRSNARIRFAQIFSFDIAHSSQKCASVRGEAK